MISLYVGLIGSGKSYSAVARMLDYLADGRRIWTNIKLCVEQANKYVGEGVINWEEQYHYLTPDKILNLFEHLPGGNSETDPVIVIIDEVSEWLDAYENDKKIREFCSFLRQSRHFGVDVELISQDEQLVHRRVRMLSAMIYRHTDGAKFKIPGLGFGLPPPWRYCFATTGFNRDGRLRLTPIRWRAKDKQLYKCYSTTETYRTFGLVDKIRQGRVISGGTMNNAQKRILIFAFILAFFSALSCAGLIYYSFATRKTEIISPAKIDYDKLATTIKNTSTNKPDLNTNNPVVKLVYFERYGYGLDINGKPFIAFGGKIYTVGDLCPHGIIKIITENMILCIDAYGKKIIKRV